MSKQWYQDYKHDIQGMTNVLNLSTDKPALPENLDDIMVFIDGRLLLPEVQFERKSDHAVKVAQLHKNQDWLVRWFV